MDNQQPSLLKISKTGPRVKNLENKTFGLLTALKYQKHKHGSGWVCKCKCGEKLFVRTYKLINNIQKACQKCTASLVTTNKEGINNLHLRKRIYREYKRGAKKRNYSFKLSEEEFYNIIFESCYFCGEEPSLYKQDLPYLNRTQEPLKRNGIDRLAIQRWMMI
jgi:hypothetical protein